MIIGFEIFLGTVLLLGFYNFWVGLNSVSLLLTFIIANFTVLLRKDKISCSQSGLLYIEKVDHYVMLRDMVLVLLAFVVVYSATPSIFVLIKSSATMAVAVCLCLILSLSALLRMVAVANTKRREQVEQSNYSERLKQEYLMWQKDAMKGG